MTTEPTPEQIRVRRVPDRPAIWGVYYGDRLLSTHTSNTAARTAASRHLEAE